MASATGCPRRRLPLLEGGAENSPWLARPGFLVGGAGNCGSCPARSQERGGQTKGTRWGRGVLEERRGYRAERPATLPFFHPHGTVEGPEARGRGNRMTGWGWGGGDSLS